MSELRACPKKNMTSSYKIDCGQMDGRTEKVDH